MSVETTSEPRIPEAPDRDEIVRVVHLYTDGIGAHKSEMFWQAFHPAARIYWTNPDGELGEQLILKDHNDDEGWAAAEWGHIEGRIIEVIQAGDVAVVVLGFDAEDPANCWVDIHTLLRLDGTWKIMAKTATHASRADWAGKA